MANVVPGSISKELKDLDSINMEHYGKIYFFSHRNLPVFFSSPESINQGDKEEHIVVKERSAWEGSGQGMVLQQWDEEKCLMR